MRIADLSTIEQEFIAAAHEMVWCNVATVDSEGRPRSRVLHPIWEVGPIGWIATGRHSPKAKHLATNSNVSLAYMIHVLKPVYVDCTAEWVDDQAEKQRIWDIFKQTPGPLGYDLARFFGQVDNPNYGLLKLTPWRVELADLLGESRFWKG